MELAADKQEKILTLLSEIESTQGVTIILAVESGSRAWGFPSQDSDYDIRFIYHHQRDWYLSAFPRRDVIDTQFIDDLDAGGWDISKCMQLLHKGNAPLYEWLHSPLIYRQDESKVDQFKEVAEKAFNPKVIFHHYLSLAKKKLRDKKTESHAKSFLYALRALLCAKWVVNDGTVPPVEFSKLQQRYLSEGQVARSLVTLLEAKAVSNEHSEALVDSALVSYAKNLFTELEGCDAPVVKGCDIALYDNLLRYIVT